MLIVRDGERNEKLCRRYDFWIDNVCFCGSCDGILYNVFLKVLYAIHDYDVWASGFRKVHNRF